ncbi:MAG: hypothetical protein SF182_21625 [Deltaproteobacteria bacterium]|nr:hypothetical protein [Deltaproteobacteria bacterium]
MAHPPNRAYYEACAGRWACQLDFAITDWRAWRGSRMALVGRLNLLALAAAVRIARLRLDTSVDVNDAARGEVVHTTRVSKWGLTLMRSIDRITLDANGRDATMRVAMSFFPLLWRAERFPSAAATIDASARRADYRIPWFGGEMHQSGALSADGATVTLVQATEFSRGVQVLRRVGNPPCPPFAKGGDVAGSAHA